MSEMELVQTNEDRERLLRAMLRRRRKARAKIERHAFDRPASGLVLLVDPRTQRLVWREGPSAIRTYDGYEPVLYRDIVPPEVSVDCSEPQP